jgi:hypothetical protein
MTPRRSRSQQSRRWSTKAIAHITVLNRDGLEDCACECYSVIRVETDKFMGPAKIHSEPHA